MNIHIAIHYVHRGNRVLRRGDFPVNRYRYNEDPLGEAVRIAKEWGNRLIFEQPEMKIEQIIVNNKDDITELVIKEMQWFNDLPF